MQLPINYTIAQIRQATKAQIITVIANYLQTLTKRQIIIWLLDNMDRIPDAPVIVRRQDGQMERMDETESDVETGEVVSTRTITWTYYPTGEVDEITVTANGTTRTIKHYIDGRQPEVIE